MASAKPRAGSGSQQKRAVRGATLNRKSARFNLPATEAEVLAAALRALQPPVQAVRYESARREGGLCEAVFDPQALALPHPHRQQTWTCKTTRQRVLLTHANQGFQFDMG